MLTYPPIMSYRYGSQPSTTTAAAPAPPAAMVGPSIDEATLTFVRTIIESPTQPHPSQALALNAFTAAFTGWNPQSLFDIKLTDKASLDLIFTVPPKQSHYDQAFEQTMQKHRYTIGTLVKNFEYWLSNGLLVLEQLRAACSAMDLQIWDSYKRYHGTQSKSRVYSTANSLPALPTTRKIKSETDKIERLRETIDKYTHVCIQGKSYSLADCDSTRDIKIDDITKLATSALQTLLNTIKGRIGDNPDFLYYYMYFKHHPSILLGAPKAPVISTQPTNFDFLESCKPIRDAFGADMTYAGVGTVLQLLRKRKVYNTEIKLLLNCEILKISARDVTNFRAVKLLHRISQPLHDALQCCVEHQFVLVESDPSFNALQAIVKNFYSTASRGRESCLDFMNQLYEKLCTADIHDANDASDASFPKINQVKLSIDALLPLQYALHGLKLRNYCRTMQWLTADAANDRNEGLEKFNTDYEAMIDFLRRNGATEELLIVDSLKPVVQLFSYLEKYCKNCLQVHELVARLKNDRDMQTLLQETVNLKVKVLGLNSRVHAIEDLFQHIATPPATTPAKASKRRKRNA